MENELPKILAIDFDGTIVENAWPKIGTMRKDADKYILRLKKAGFTIIIWTCREGKDQEDAIQFLKDNNIPFDYVNENPQVMKDFYSNDSRKIGADLYIDDKMIGFNNMSWEDIYTAIKEFFPDVFEMKLGINGIPMRLSFDDWYYSIV